MKIPILIQARMSSQRLPGKVLINVQGKPILEYVLNQLRKCRDTNIIVCTSTDKSDDTIQLYCQNNQVQCFRGDLHNVVFRFKEAIEMFGLDCFIRISADSPLFDPNLINEGIKIFKENKYDIVTNVFKRTYPKGQSFEILKSQIFLDAIADMNSSDDLEHVTKYFYRNTQKFKIYNIDSGYDAILALNMCIDSQSDLELFIAILNKEGKGLFEKNWKEVMQIYKRLEHA